MFLQKGKRWNKYQEKYLQVSDQKQERIYLGFTEMLEWMMNLLELGEFEFDDELITCF